MTRLAGHGVDEGLTVGSPAPLPVVDGVDVELSLRNVVAWGGDGDRYRHFVGEGVTTEPNGRGFATLAAAAAWRSGVLALRDDVLGRLAALLAGDPEQPSEAGAAAALGLRPGLLGAFVAGQRDDPFAWPSGLPATVTGPVVARIGGFRGLGGPWRTPPVETAPLDDGGTAWVVWTRPVDPAAGPVGGEVPGAVPGAGHVLGEAWRVDADVFGSRVVRLDPDDDVLHEAARRRDAGAGTAPPRFARLEVSERSYLAYLIATERP